MHNLERITRRTPVAMYRFLHPAFIDLNHNFVIATWAPEECVSYLRNDIGCSNNHSGYGHQLIDIWKSTIIISHYLHIIRHRGKTADFTFWVERSHVPWFLHIKRPNLYLELEYRCWVHSEEYFVDYDIETGNYILGVVNQLTVKLRLKLIQVFTVYI